MSDASKLIARVTGGLLPEHHVDSLKDLAATVTGLPKEVKNVAADIALHASGISITDLLGRLTPGEKAKVVAWAEAYKDK